MYKQMCGGSHMTTNLALDPKLLDRALKVSGQKTKKAAVTLALEEFIAKRAQKNMLELMGKLEWDESYDYKAERSR
jgi:Arc/MetJ family transcription regulator